MKQQYLKSIYFVLLIKKTLSITSNLLLVSNSTKTLIYSKKTKTTVYQLKICSFCLFAVSSFNWAGNEW